jgi:hypothetical protein
MMHGVFTGTELTNIPAALGHMDFVNHSYSYGGASLTVAQVLNSTGQGYVTTDGGLHIATGADPAEVIGDFATRLFTCQWTIVMEVEIVLNVGTGQSDSIPEFLFLQNYDGLTHPVVDTLIRVGRPQEWDVEDSSDTQDRLAWDVHALGQGIHKVAVTRIDSRLAVSVDGFPPVNQQTGGGLTTGNFPLPGAFGAMIHAMFGAQWNTGTRDVTIIRKFAIYDPVPDGFLPVLSKLDASSGIMDFVAQTFSFNGVSLTAAQVLDSNALAWLDTGAGLVIPPSVTNPNAGIIGPFLDKLLTCQWTAVLEVELLSSTQSGDFLTVYNSDATHSPTDECWIRIAYFSAWDFSDLDRNIGFRDTNNSITFAAGLHKIAVTRKDAMITYSVDGGPVLSINTTTSSVTGELILPNDANTMVWAGFGALYGNPTQDGGTIKSFAIYDPQPDGDLPGLST